jgi:hypothetical protein
MPYLGFCAIARDEDPFLEEWIAYHTLLGVEAFFIYDHQSTTPIAESLAPLVKHGLVHVIPVTGEAPQLPGYNHCLTEFGHDFEWIGFFDLDEFLVPKHVDDLRVMLTEFESYAALCVNWINFGTSGHVQRPGGLLTENFTLACNAAEWSSHIKSFVRPATVRAFRGDPHFPSFRAGSVVVNEQFRPFWGPFSPLSHDRCQINHYYFKSLEDYRNKLSRGRADGGVHPGSPAMHGDVPDTAIQRFVPRLKELMALGDDAIAKLACLFTQERTEEEALRLASEYAAQGHVDRALALLCNACRQHSSSRRLRLLKLSLVEQRFPGSRGLTAPAYAARHMPRIAHFLRRVANKLKKILARLTG